MDSHCSKVKRPKCVLTSMNAATQIFAMKMLIVTTNWAVIVANVGAVSLAMVSFANAFPIAPTYHHRLNERNRQNRCQLLK